MREAQARDGSCTQYARAFEAGGEVRNAEIGPDEAAFIQAQRSFYERDQRIARLEAELARALRG